MADAPTFLFGLGAQKAGTTWLAEYFRLHPQIHVPPVKEVHYFDAKWLPSSGGFERNRRKRLDNLQNRGVEGAELDKARSLVDLYEGEDHRGYREFMLRGHRDEACIADITPSYCNLHRAHLEQMLDGFAPAKMLFILRDPVQRMWSQIRMHLIDRDGEATREAADQLIAAMMRGRGKVIWDRSRLAATVRRVRALPEGRAHIMYYETLFAEPQIRELCGFMGVDFVPAPYQTRVREGAILKMTPAQHATLRWLNDPEYRAIHALEGAAIPDAWEMDWRGQTWPEVVTASEDDEQILQGPTT